MKKGFIIAILVAALLLTLPAMATVEQPVAKAPEAEMVKVFCKIEGETTTVEMSYDTIEDIIELGKNHMQDFLVIYNKWESEEAVDEAFENIQPFFEALVESKLSRKSVDELNDLFRDIRSWIQKPRKDPSPLYRNPRSGDEPHPTLYLWNGVPTPIVFNAACGIMTVGAPALGYSLGTHTILPGPGIDIANTWYQTGASGSVGLFGGHIGGGLTEFGMDLGFVGILIGVWPSGIILGFIFQVGFALFITAVSFI